MIRYQQVSPLHQATRALSLLSSQVAAGTYSLDYQVTDSSNPQGAEDADFTITVLDSRPQPLTLPAVSDIDVALSDLPTTRTLPAATGGSGTVQYTLSFDNTAVLFNAETRELTIRADAVVGATPCVYSASDGTTTVQQNFQINITETLTLPPVAQIHVRKDADRTEQVLPAVTGGRGTVVYSLTSLPSGTSFNPITRTLSINPAVISIGTYTLTYAATVGTQTVREQIQLIVRATPQIASDNTQQVRDKAVVSPNIAEESGLLQDVFSIITECGVGEESGVITPLSRCGNSKVAKLLTTETGVRFDQATQTLYINNDTFNGGRGGTITLEFECVEDE